MMREIVNHPKPQFRRSEWMDLNGTWQFKFDEAKEGIKQGWQNGLTTELEIMVPFVYQSELSGIHQTKFCSTVWYQREISIDLAPNKHYILHFEGVDYDSTVWVNGQYVGNHVGGNSSFSFNIQPFLKDGKNLIVLKATDYLEDMTIPRGKQYWKEQAEVMWFTQMTGIWRDVWLEEKPEIAIEDFRLTPDIDGKKIDIELFLSEETEDAINIELLTTVTFAESIVAKTLQLVNGKQIKFSIGLADFNDHGLGYWWSPAAPNLYDIKFKLIEHDHTHDIVDSYFGMRKVSIEKNKFCLNNRPYFVQAVLDQGYFKESILTAPSFKHLEKDVCLMKELGFNTVRKHMMSSESRFLYLCDYYGLLVWSEMAASYDYSEKYAFQMMDEWKSVLLEGYNHPSVVTWVPLNESWGIPEVYHSKKQQAHAQSLYYLTKSIDDTRPVISNDGWEHCKSDIFTIHDYTKDTKVLEKRYNNVDQIMKDMPGLNGKKFLYAQGFEYNDEPVMCTEMGGINYQLNGLGDPVEPRVHTEEEFLKEIRNVVQAYYESPIIEGICYTQLTDTETEICGLLTWDREPKASIEDLREIFDKGVN